MLLLSPPEGTRRPLSLADRRSLTPSLVRSSPKRAPIAALAQWSLVAALVLTVAVGARYFAARPARHIEGQVRGAFPVVIRTNGGVLEVATIVDRQTFNLTEVLIVAGIKVPFCKATASYTVDAYFTYRVRLSRDWAAFYRDGRLQVTAPKLEPATPVSFDTSNMNATLRKCPLIPRGTQDDLLRSISTKLADEALDPRHIQMAREGGARNTVREFAQKWLVSQKFYDVPAGTPIDVKFEDE